MSGDLPIWEGNAFQSLFRNVQDRDELDARQFAMSF